MRQTKQSYCNICAAKCGVIVSIEGDTVTSVRGDPDHPLSHGYTCSKGRALPEVHHHARRLNDPLVRRDGSLHAVPWDESLDGLGERLKRIVEEHGADAVALYWATGAANDIIGKSFAEAFVRGIGSKSVYSAITIDTAANFYLADLVGGFPFLALPITDHENATLVIFVGQNPIVSHGHTNAMPDPVVTLRKTLQRGEIWVLDPRRTETAALATRHLSLRPGSDYVLLAHAVRELLRDGADWDFLNEHAIGVDELTAAVEPFDRDTAVVRTGLTGHEVDDFVAAIRRHGRLSLQVGTGVSMAAEANLSEWMGWALHAVTGSLERPGGTWFNPGVVAAMDGGGTDGIFTGAVMAASPPDSPSAPGPASRPEVPSRLGEYSCGTLADEILAGNVRALVVAGGNPITALPNSRKMVEALSRLEVLLVADVVENEVTDLATDVFPCAHHFERADLNFAEIAMPAVMTQYVPAMVPLTARRKPMWWVFAALGRRLGLDLLPQGLTLESCTDDDLLRGSVHPGSRLTFDEIRASPTAIVVEGPVFGWVERLLLPDGRWRVAPPPLLQQLREFEGRPSSSELSLIVRRQARRMNSGVSSKPEAPYALINPVDADAAGVVDGSMVMVTSATGSIRTVARVADTIREGAVSMNHGFAETNVSQLTSENDVDPLSGMVRQSGIPVSIAPAT
jgi:anaerobic selenocysteine-containing dehydrogenase